MSKVVFYLGLLSVIFASFSLQNATRAKKAKNSIENLNIKYPKELKLEYQISKLKDIQELTSEKITSCWKNKTCFKDESFRELIFKLRLQSQIIESFASSCPSFQPAIKDYVERVKNIEKLSGFYTSSKVLDEMGVPLALESWTRQVIDISQNACPQEYAYNQ